MGRSAPAPRACSVEALQQEGRAIGPLLVQYLIQRFDPFGSFARVQVDNTFGEFLVHGVIFIIATASKGRDGGLVRWPASIFLRTKPISLLFSETSKK